MRIVTYEAARGPRAGVLREGAVISSPVTSSTGTPAGVGGARDPRAWLRLGDELVVSSPQLGELRTPIGG